MAYYQVSDRSPFEMLTDWMTAHDWSEWEHNTIALNYSQFKAAIGGRVSDSVTINAEDSDELRRISGLFKVREDTAVTDGMNTKGDGLIGGTVAVKTKGNKLVMIITTDIPNNAARTLATSVFQTSRPLYLLGRPLIK